MESHSVANHVHAGRAARIAGDLIELQERERGMLAIIESAQDLSSRLDLTSLLSAIVSRARNLLGILAACVLSVPAVPAFPSLARAYEVEHYSSIAPTTASRCRSGTSSR